MSQRAGCFLSGGMRRTRGKARERVDGDLLGRRSHPVFSPQRAHEDDSLDLNFYLFLRSLAQKTLRNSEP